MTPQPWLYTVLLVVVGFHALAVLYAYWVTRDTTDAVEPTGRLEGSPSEEVICPNCGTTNERGYTYCGNCVSELPGGRTVDRNGLPPTGREIS